MTANPQTLYLVSQQKLQTNRQPNIVIFIFKHYISSYCIGQSNIEIYHPLIIRNQIRILGQVRGFILTKT